MKRLVTFGALVAVIAVLQLPVGAATPILSEDFEGATVGADPIVSGPLTWQARVAVSNRSTEGVYGTDGKLIIGEIGGSKHVELQDLNSTTYSMDSLVTSQALIDHNSGNGIRKGSVQMDWTMVSGIAYTEINVYDDVDITTGFPVNGTQPQNIAARNDCLVHVRVNSGVFQIRTTSATDGTTAVLNTGPAITVGNTYRFLFTFDVDTRDLAVTIQEKTPTGPFAEVFNVTGQIYSRSDAADPFKGVRGIEFYQGVAALQTIAIDNLIFTDTDTPQPEVAVSVDATDVPSGGTVNFGAPAVGVATSKTFTVSNTGAADLTTSNIVLPAGYTLATGETLAATIAASTSDTFVVDLDVAAEGVKDGVITFDTNDADEAAYTINVTANVGSTNVEDWQDR